MKPSNTGGYSCEKCGGTTIYLSQSPIDHKGTLSCQTCGGTEDAAIGILKDGKRLMTYCNQGLAFYLKKNKGGGE